MAVSLANISRARADNPPRITMHGVPGVGKTQFAASAPRPIFIITEDGLGRLEVDHFPLATRFSDVMDALASLYTEPHEFQTIVIDSLDWLEPLIYAEACRMNGWETIESPGYGKGYAAALSVWGRYIDGINALRNDKGMTVIQIAHTEIKRFDSPEHDPYHRYVIKLHEKASALIREHSDVVLFANYRVAVKGADVGFNKKVTRATGSGERLMYANERPAFMAKNRYGLPDVMPLSWDDFMYGMRCGAEGAEADE
jgi:hypothetical protein